MARASQEDRRQSRGSRRGTMTTAEAGRIGGRRTAQTHGREFYESIGQKGGETVAEEYGPEFYSEIGRKGGRRTAETHGREFYEDIGHKGGETVAREYGPEFYSEIGRRGGRAVRDEYGPEFYSEIGRRGGLSRGSRNENFENEDEYSASPRRRGSRMGQGRSSTSSRGRRYEQDEDDYE